MWLVRTAGRRGLTTPPRAKSLYPETRERKVVMEMTTFKDAPGMTAEEKTKAMDNWTRFAWAVCDESKTEEQKLRKLTNRLYDHLCQHCGFEWWHSKRGFFNHYFGNEVTTVKSLDQFLRGRTREVISDVDRKMGNDRLWLFGDYADLNRAMCLWLIARWGEYAEELRKDFFELLNRDVFRVMKTVLREGSEEWEETYVEIPFPSGLVTTNMDTGEIFVRPGCEDTVNFILKAHLSRV